MNLLFAWTFAVRELRTGLKEGLRGFRVFLACITLGVATIAALGSLQAAVEVSLRDNGARLLGGDAELEFTYRFATDQERGWIDKQAKRVSEIAEFRSMLTKSGTQDRGLTQVKAIDTVYPLYGAVKLNPDISLDTALQGQNEKPGIILAPVLAARLGVQIGETVTLGETNFVYNATLIEEPDATVSFALGPRSMVRLDALQDSGLLKAGTLFSASYRMDLGAEPAFETIRQKAQTELDGSGASWQDAREGAPGLSEFATRLGAFLTLVGLSGLAVGGVGIGTAVREYLDRKTSVIAILRTLGAARSTVFATFFFIVIALSLIGLAIGLVLGAALPFTLVPFISDLLPVSPVIALYAQPLAEAALYGGIGALIFALWPLSRSEAIAPATLFRDAFDTPFQFPRKRYLGALVVLVALFCLSAIAFSGAARLALWVIFGLAMALVLLGLTSMAVRSISKRLGRSRLPGNKPGLRLALGSIGGPRAQSLAVVLSLGLGLSVLSAVGQIDGNLRSSIQNNLPEVAPSFFFVDIQSNQLDGFTKQMLDDPAVSKLESAPMLRGIITKINGKPAKEVAPDHWVLQGDRGVTYAETPPPNATVTQGAWWPADYTGPMQISFSQEEALEMGLSLGDEMSINILGRELTGTITSFRNVDFSTAGIGFIMSVNPSALAGAPHSHIATAYADQTQEARLLREVSRGYPNVTAISVREAIDRVADLLGGVARGTAYAALASLVTGFLVLIGAAASGTASRTYEAAILRSLGATQGMLIQSFVLRALILGAAAGFVALATGLLAAWAVTQFVLDTSYSVFWGNALLIVGGGIAANVVANLLFLSPSLNAKPATTLRAKL